MRDQTGTGSRISPRLLAAWLWLVGLGAVVALLTAAQGPGLVPARLLAGAAVLLLSLVKARVILSRYLGLDRSPRWLDGFTWAVSAWGLLALALYLAAAVAG